MFLLEVVSLYFYNFIAEYFFILLEQVCVKSLMAVRFLEGAKDAEDEGSTYCKWFRSNRS